MNKVLSSGRGVSEGGASSWGDGPGTAMAAAHLVGSFGLEAIMRLRSVCSESLAFTVVFIFR